ncbi:MAG: ABC transporter permease [Acidimicrobiia bacterium]
MKRSKPGRSLPRRLASALATTLVSVGALILVWQVFLWVLDVDPFVGKTPVDVFHYLFTDEGHAANRHEVVSLFFTTIWDATLGLVVGGFTSIAVAVLFVVSRPLERTFMPIALALRSVPVIAMTPVLVLIFGYSRSAVIAVVGIVVFFPTLVLVSHGLRSVSSEAFDLLSVYDADRITVFRKVRLPSALPSIFAAARVAGPGAIVGALLGEWLASGKGLGYRLISDTVKSRYNELWAAAVLITATAIAIYEIIGAIERAVLDRYRMN